MMAAIIADMLRVISTIIPLPRWQGRRLPPTPQC
jgi:hypothetical protein